jgi:hypothetical protein
MIIVNHRAQLIARLAAMIHAGECSDHENYNKDDVSIAIKSAELIVKDVERDHGAIFTEVSA